MIVGLIGLFALLFFGGGYDSIMLNPEMEKNVKTYVLDKDRVKEISHIIKQMSDSQEAFAKGSKKKAIKTFQELNLNYYTKSEDFHAILDPLFTSLAVLQKGNIDSELKIRALINEDEWNNIMTMVVNTPDKEKVKNQVKKLSDEMKDHLIKACKSSITDSIALSSALILADAYGAKSLNFAEKLMDLGYKNHESIRKYNAPREDFEALASEILHYRKDYMHYIVDLRFQLKTLVDESTWSDMAKALNNGLSQ